MNIFFLDKDPKVSADLMHNKHVVKMILESAQMLCTAFHELGYSGDIPYKKAYVNHPMTIWTRTTGGNFNWLIKHAKRLCKIYTKQYNRVHKTQAVIDWCDANKKDLIIFIDNRLDKTIPPKCMPNEHKIDGDTITDVVHSYLNYYVMTKIKKDSSWGYREKPNFFYLF